MSDLIGPIMSRYANFTMTGDGLAEINSLAYLGFESEFPRPGAGSKACAGSSRASSSGFCR